jgi:hypothetical protein
LQGHCYKAQKWISEGLVPNSFQQGLKPIDFIGFIGTTEVVPCYKAPSGEFFRSL